MKSFKVAILFCAIVAVQGRARRDVAEAVTEDGGTEIPISQVPYQAAMLINGRLSCGGSIIADRWILTAAHCVPGVTTSQMRIRVGSADSLSGGQELRVSRIISHARYNSRTMDFDVALVQVSSSITQGRRISLANTEPAAGTTVKVSGWGAMRSGGQVTRTLRGVDVSIVARSTCERNYGTGEITRRMICAARDGRDSCQGDSGGPLALGNSLVGVVSWGQGCAQRGYPGVYANVANSEIRQFINQNVNFS
ncbi:trypsin alpha-3-like [Atheta coriaria]|uniref:trypsin alpha-3-like n=1 Tax=Dalotia coriaria TaxID=877792 RepID=UPI0031F42851